MYEGIPAVSAEGEVVVKVERIEAPPKFISQRNCSTFGFPNARAFLAFLANHEVPATAAGALRLVDADVLAQHIRAAAKTRPRRAKAPPSSHVGDEHPDAALKRAGLKVREGAR